MLKKLLPQNIIFSLSLVRELTSVLITKVIAIFTLIHVYFSTPILFESRYLFDDIQSNTLIAY